VFQSLLINKYLERRANRRAVLNYCIRHFFITATKHVRKNNLKEERIWLMVSEVFSPHLAGSIAMDL
jgi:hypothetical protein